MALSDNCVLYRKLDETSGTTASDASGNSNNGTANNTWATGKINNGWTFNGSSQQIYTAGSVFSGTGNFTIAMWIKTGSVGTRLLQKRESNASWFFIYTIADNGKQWYLDYNWSTFTNNHNSNNVVHDGNWHLVWVSRNGNTITFWKDWVSDWWGTGTLLSLNTHKLNFWTDYVDGWKWFNWQADEIWVWTRELSSTEWTTLYNWWSWLQYPFTIANTQSAFLTFFL